MSMEKAIREKQISMMVKLYYVRCPFLQYEPLDLLIEKALNKYLDSDLSIEQINDELADAIRERRNNINRDNTIKEMVEEKNEIVEEAKQKKLTPTSNEEGFIHNMIITTLALITFALSSIGLIVLYLLKY